MLRGVKTKTFLFTLRLSYSGKAVHRAFATQGQEAFLEGHVHAFDRLGGVPVDKIRYDNLKAAVSRVLFGRNRVESDRWVAFRSHYGFDAFYCQPGVDGAHEKGGVEGEGGRFRRNHCVPMPEVDSIAELNELLAAADAKDEHRRIGNRAQTVGHDCAVRAGAAAAAAGRGVPDLADADPAGRPVRPGHGPAVPVLGAGEADRPPGPGPARRLRRCAIFDGRSQVARHERVDRPRRPVADLGPLPGGAARKPGALPGATALAQARAAGAFTPAHEAFWACARRPGSATPPAPGR